MSLKECSINCRFAHQFGTLLPEHATSNNKVIEIISPNPNVLKCEFKGKTYNMREISISSVVHKIKGQGRILREAVSELVLWGNNSECNLYIHIPLKKGTDKVHNAEIEKIVAVISTPSGSYTNQLTSPINFRKVVIPSPFFYYSDGSCASDSGYHIVFETIQKIKTNLTKQDVKKISNAEYNKGGPSPMIDADDIYIDCAPVGADDEEQVLLSRSSMFDATQLRGYAGESGNMLNNTYVQRMLGVIFLVGVMGVIERVLMRRKS
jgi:hypothetical protein